MPKVQGTQRCECWDNHAVADVTEASCGCRCHDDWAFRPEKAVEDLATIPARHYGIFLEVRDLAGTPITCELQLIPTGFSSTTPASYWTLLLHNLAKRGTDWITRWERDLDSLRGGHQQRLPF